MDYKSMIINLLEKIENQRFLKAIVTVQDTHYPKMKSGFPEIAFLIAS